RLGCIAAERLRLIPNFFRLFIPARLAIAPAQFEIDHAFLNGWLWLLPNLLPRRRRERVASFGLIAASEQDSRRIVDLLRIRNTNLLKRFARFGDLIASQMQFGQPIVRPSPAAAIALENQRNLIVGRVDRTLDVWRILGQAAFGQILPSLRAGFRIVALSQIVE